MRIQIKLLLRLLREIKTFLLSCAMCHQREAFFFGRTARSWKEDLICRGRGAQNFVRSFTKNHRVLGGTNETSFNAISRVGKFLVNFPNACSYLSEASTKNTVCFFGTAGVLGDLSQNPSSLSIDNSMTKLFSPPTAIYLTSSIDGAILIVRERDSLLITSN